MLNILTIFKLFTNINHYCSWISGAVIIYVFYRFFFKRNSHHPPLLSQITSFGGLVLAFLVIWFLFFKSPHQVDLEPTKKLLNAFEKAETEIIKIRGGYQDLTAGWDREIDFIKTRLIDLRTLQGITDAEKTKIDNKIIEIDNLIKENNKKFTKKQETLIIKKEEKKQKESQRDELLSEQTNIEEQLKSLSTIKIRADLNKKLDIIGREIAKLQGEIHVLEKEIRNIEDEIVDLGKCEKTLQASKKSLISLAEGYGKGSEQIKSFITKYEALMKEAVINKKNCEDKIKKCNEMLTYIKKSEILLKSALQEGTKYNLYHKLNGTKITDCITGCFNKLCDSAVSYCTGKAFAQAAVKVLKDVKGIFAPTVITFSPEQQKAERYKEAPKMLDQTTYEILNGDLEKMKREMKEELKEEEKKLKDFHNLANNEDFAKSTMRNMMKDSMLNDADNQQVVIDAAQKIGSNMVLLMSKDYTQTKILPAKQHTLIYNKSIIENDLSPIQSALAKILNNKLPINDNVSNEQKEEAIKIQGDADIVIVENCTGQPPSEFPSS